MSSEFIRRVHFSKLLTAWGLKWDRVGGIRTVEVGARSVYPVFGVKTCSGSTCQRAVKHVINLSAFVLLVCFSGRDNHVKVVLVLALLCETVVSPSPPSVPHLSSFPFSPLHEWPFCHYFLTAGGDPNNLVNPLTTNCLLLLCCLDKQPGGGRSSPSDL